MILNDTYKLACVVYPKYPLFNNTSNTRLRQYLRSKEVVIDIIREKTNLFKSGNWPFFHQLEEDVISTFVILLISYTRFLEQVDINEASSELAKLVKVDPDELSLLNIKCKM